MKTEFKGGDLAEAIAAAAAALSLPPEILKFNVLSTGSKGFLGLGRRPARISVDPDDPALSLADDGPRPNGPIPNGPGPADPEPASGPEPDERDKNEKFPPLDFSHLPPPPTRPGPGEVPEENPGDEAALRARATLWAILERMSVAAEISAVRFGSRLALRLDGPEKGLLIGPRGATLEALQFLLSQIMARQSPPGGEADRLFLEVGDYRDRRRRQFLDQLKTQMEAVRRTARPRPVSCPHPEEKRLARLALRAAPDLTFKAAGGRLLIAPAGSGRPKPGRRL